MEKMLHDAKAFKNCPSRWRQGYADGIEDALFCFKRIEGIDVNDVEKGNEIK